MSDVLDESAEWSERVAWARVRVEEVLRGLPEALRADAVTVPVEYLRVPSAELMEDGIEGDSLGLFAGATREEIEAGESRIPPKILLFLENLWEFSDFDREVFEEEVEITFLHELGHFLGLDEDDLYDRGLE